MLTRFIIQRTLPTTKLRTSIKPFSTTFPQLSANKASHNPPSDNAGHAAQNAREEASKVAHDVTNMIAGGHSAELGSEHKTHPSMAAEFKTITSGLYVKIPKPAILWGAAGVIPYFGTTLSHIYLSSQLYAASMGVPDINVSHVSEILQHVENIQVGYGAAMLSFLGAIHWGMEFAELGGRQGNPRYAVGVVPVLVSALSTLPGWQLAMILQWGGFAYQWGIDTKLTQKGWTPHWFAAYRFWLTLVVGSTILLTLGGANYFTLPVGHRLEDRRANQSEKTGKVVGHTPTEANTEIDEDSTGNAFGVIKKKHEGSEESEESDKEE